MLSMSIVYSFLLLYNIPLYSYTTIHLPIHLLMDIYIAACDLIQPIYFTHGETKGKGEEDSREGTWSRSKVHLRKDEKATCYPGRLCQEA